MTPHLDPTIPNPTAQQVFDGAVRHLMAQGRQALTGSACCYRTSDGKLACGVGGLLTDTEADMLKLAGLNNRGVGMILRHERTRDFFPRRLHEHGELLSELQGVHDQAPTQDWPDALRRVAQKHSLGCRI